MVAPIMIGVVLAGVYVTVAARRGPRGEVQLLAIGLVIAALIYVGFALADGERSSIIREVAGLLLFGALAWVGTRVSAAWLAFGWAAHAAWDVGLHLDRSQSIAPEWYPHLCVGLDLIVAGFVLGSVLRGRAVASKAR